MPDGERGADFLTNDTARLRFLPILCAQPISRAGTRRHRRAIGRRTASVALSIRNGRGAFRFLAARRSKRGGRSAACSCNTSMTRERHEASFTPWLLAAHQRSRPLQRSPYQHHRRIHQPRAQPAAPAVSAPASAVSARAAEGQESTIKCDFSSTPSGAEITIDGKYVGSTPSEIEVSTGTHVVEFSLPGFTQWKRELTVLPGSELTVSAVLQKVQ